jgi:hypothetical protein
LSFGKQRKTLSTRPLDVDLAEKYRREGVIHEPPDPYMGDFVRVITSAPAKYRPGMVGDVCGVWTIDSAENSEARGEPLGTTIYTVEFGDGTSADVPECYLEKAEVLSK